MTSANIGPTSYSQVLDRINYLSTLEKGWFDNDREPVSTKAIENAKALALRLWGEIPLQWCFPTLEGGILFEWDPPGYGIFLECHADGSVEYTCVDDVPGLDSPLVVTIFEYPSMDRVAEYVKWEKSKGRA